MVCKLVRLYQQVDFIVYLFFQNPCGIYNGITLLITMRIQIVLCYRWNFTSIYRNIFRMKSVMTMTTVSTWQMKWQNSKKRQSKRKNQQNQFSKWIKWAQEKLIAKSEKITTSVAQLSNNKNEWTISKQVRPFLGVYPLMPCASAIDRPPLIVR